MGEISARLYSPHCASVVPRLGQRAALDRLFRMTRSGHVSPEFGSDHPSTDEIHSYRSQFDCECAGDRFESSQIPAAMTHPFCGRKPIMPLVRMIDPVDLIRLPAYFAATAAPQKRTWCTRSNDFAGCDCERIKFANGRKEIPHSGFLTTDNFRTAADL